MKKVIAMDKTFRKILNLRKRIPSFKCVPGCYACCGPTIWTRAEWKRVKVKKKAISLTCPYASEKGCEVYKDRPIICRLFGVVKSLPCIYGGIPERILTEEEEKKIMDEYWEILRRR